MGEYPHTLEVKYWVHFECGVEFTPPDAERIKLRVREAVQAELRDWAFLNRCSVEFLREGP
jgi:hypothetical protein